MASSDLLPPGPNVLQTLLYALQLRNRNIEAVLPRLYERYGPIIRVELPPNAFVSKLVQRFVRTRSRPYIIMVGTEANRFLATSDPALVERGPIIPVNFPAGEGKVVRQPSLASVDGILQKRHHKLVMQAFRPSSLESYIPFMIQSIERRTTTWDTSIDLFQEMSSLSREALALTMLGIQPGSSFYNEFFSHYWTIALRVTSSHLDQVRTAGTTQAKTQLWSLLRAQIEQKRIHPGQDAISTLISSHDAETDLKLQDEDLLNYSYMLIDFGHSDIAIFLTYALGMLVVRPELLRRLLNEHDQFSINSLMHLDTQLPFTTNLLREVERLYPPVASIFRYAAQDLQFGQYRIPKHSWLVGSIWLTHRLPTLFSQPLEFDPDRFALPRAEPKTPYALMGFGGGFHACVASSFTRILASLVLHILLSQYRFRLLGTPELPPIDYRGTFQNPARSIRLEVSAL